MTDAGVASIVTGVVTIATMVVGFLTMWVKLRHGEAKADVLTKKVDKNTEITKANTEVASAAATVAANKTEELVKQMNGALDQRITAIVKHHADALLVVLQNHTEQDDKNMREIRAALEAMKVK